MEKTNEIKLLIEQKFDKLRAEQTLKNAFDKLNNQISKLKESAESYNITYKTKMKN